MNQLQLYPEAWIVYILLGLVLLFLLDLKLRKRPFSLRAGLLSLIAVLAFTPEVATDAETFAPKVITSLLNAETQGIVTFYQGLMTLTIIWGIVFTIVLAIRYWLLARKKSLSPNLMEGDNNT